MNKKISLFIVLPAAALIIAMIFYGFPNCDSDAGNGTKNPVKVTKVRASPAVASAPQAVQVQKIGGPSKAENSVAASSELSKFSGFGHAIDRDEAQFSKEEKAQQELIATCMQSNSFEYTPEPSIAINEEALSNAEEFERLLTEASSSPNDAYVNSLSATMRKSYYLTLTGMENPDDPEGQAHDLAQYGDSCVGKAFQQIPGVYAKRNLLSKEFEAMEAQFEEDERIITATERWSACISDEGYAFSKPKDTFRSADETMAKLIDEKADAEQMKSAESEINKMMQANGRCIKKTRLVEVRQRVRIEYENQFVKNYKTQLTN